MGPVDILLIILLVLVIGAAVFLMVRNKRKGKGCSGCCENCSLRKEGSGCR